MAPQTGGTQVAPPLLFKAVTSSTKPLFQLLKCINFTNKVHVEITESGLRISADNARVMQGVAMLDRSLFSSFQLNLDTSNGGNDDDSDDDDDNSVPAIPSFQINFASFLETLQILGSVDLANRAAKVEQDAYRSTTRNYRPEAFSNQALGIAGSCSLVYSEHGAPFSIIIEEAGVKTTANLTTYSPEMPEEIPFDRADLMFKIIMPPRHLLDAFAELAIMAPAKLVISALPTQPWLVLTGRGGELGASSYDFSRARELMESAVVRAEWAQTYRFDLVRAACEAMRIANKVSFRGDRQGVLSLQFMVEVEGADMNFLDFRFVPFVGYDEDEEAEDEYEEDPSEDEVGL
ncbi:checkpoint clamp complex protein Rad1 [Ceratocystis pirilliformis]|uniref:Checkpoint clamp complex protein Rad1 n=1 Tax=Ceratocystis pirilliformis TaxID=259994 RepID=A0ABR3YSB0_9PEZI